MGHAEGKKYANQHLQIGRAFLPKRLFVFLVEGKRLSSLRQYTKDSLGRPCDPRRTASSTCQTATTRCSTPTRIRLAILKRRLLCFLTPFLQSLFVFCYYYTFFLLCCCFPLVHKWFAVISCFIFASYLGFSLRFHNMLCFSLLQKDSSIENLYCIASPHFFLFVVLFSL